VAAIRRKRFSKEVDGGVYATDGIAMIVRPSRLVATHGQANLFIRCP
jgi:hypothetical protein